MSEIRFVPVSQLSAVRNHDSDSVTRTRLFSTLSRINTLSMISYAGSGHIGSSFSSMDIFSWLFLNVLRRVNQKGGEEPRDIFFSSKGHDVPGIYAVMIGCGLLPEEGLRQLRRLEGLPGHPDVGTDYIVTNTGSLGMGISKARGMAIADRLRDHESHYYVLTGDGELQEGQFWESLSPTVNNGVNNITVIVDHNKLQSDTYVSQTSDLGDLEAKFAAFGWYVDRCDGNALEAFSAAMARCAEVNDRPKVIIADTVKGNAVTFMEPGEMEEGGLYDFHSGAPTEEEYDKALTELVMSANQQLQSLGLSELSLESYPSPQRPTLEKPQKLITAYAEELLVLGRECPELLVLDADLMLDCGLTPFAEEFPRRFIECGIAEQDMVSQAGGMALQGFLPIVHSFACFLSARPNEQIYNNATERTKIIYTGSLAGILPSGPGHSHQSVRDIAALSAVPELLLLQPCCEEEVRSCLRWAVTESQCSTYLRLESIPFDIPYEYPVNLQMIVGQGITLHDGDDVVLIGYGATLLSEAWHAASLLSEHGIEVKVINMPWLNRVDHQWLLKTIEGCKILCLLENHYAEGGQSQCVLSGIAEYELGDEFSVITLGINEIPVCGQNDEVLQVLGLDAKGIAQYILSEFSGKN